MTNFIESIVSNIKMTKFSNLEEDKNYVVVRHLALNDFLTI